MQTLTLRGLTAFWIVAAASIPAHAADVDNVKTFGAVGKEQHVLRGGVLQELRPDAHQDLRGR